jgi:hypothetical protein
MGVGRNLPFLKLLTVTYCMYVSLDCNPRIFHAKHSRHWAFIQTKSERGTSSSRFALFGPHRRDCQGCSVWYQKHNCA